MLLSFTVENWMSFREPATLSMIATNITDHEDRIHKMQNGSIRILPIATIYGANGSGKTAFVEALRFCQDMVLNKSSIKLMTIFEKCINLTDIKKPSNFKFEFIINEKIYEFSFSLSRKEDVWDKVLDEKLSEITYEKEKIFYDRKDGIINSRVEEVFDDKLILTSHQHKGMDVFRSIYEWFLNIIYPFSCASEVTKDRAEKSRLYIIDGFGKNMHTLLNKNIIETFLYNCGRTDSRAQLILTTHDTILVDKDILRVDEIWITERDSQTESTLTSFSNYQNVLTDKDLRKSYLQGRLGGIPILPSFL